MAEKQERARRPLWDFLFFDKKLPRKPEVMRIAAATGTHRRWVVCALMEFWSWVDDHYPNGRLDGFSVTDLSQICPETTPEFWRAVSAVGWLTQTEAGLEIPNADRWLGETSKKRMQDRLRQWNNRYKSTTCHTNGVTEGGQETDSNIPVSTEEIEIYSEIEIRGMNPPITPSCTETGPSPSAVPPVLTYHCDGNTKTWDLTQDRIDHWSSVFPHLDILGECKKAWGWLEANATRRKTATGMARFLYGWLQRSQNRAAGGGTPARKESVQDRLDRLLPLEGE